MSALKVKKNLYGVGVLVGDVKLTNPLLFGVTRGIDTETALEMLKL